MMKSSIIFFLLFVSFQSFGQKFSLREGEFMDTTINVDTTCKDYNFFYYQVKAKYPKSSSTLLTEVQTFLQQESKSYTGNGYVTFRFKIDCAGNKMKKTEVLQTDENYKSFHFDKQFVNDLYMFLNTMNKWIIATDKNGNKFAYNAFITFKIKNGKVINIVP